MNKATEQPPFPNVIPMTISDAVIAAEIRGSLGGRHDVIGRHRKVGGGQLDLGDCAALGSVEFDGGVDRGGDLGSDALAEEALRNADAELLGVTGRRERAVGRAEAGHVSRVGRGQGIKEQFAVFDAAGHRADLIE